VFITIFNASNTFYPLQMILKLNNKNTCSFSVVSFLIKKLNDMSYNTLWWSTVQVCNSILFLAIYIYSHVVVIYFQLKNKKRSWNYQMIQGASWKEVFIKYLGPIQYLQHRCTKLNFRNHVCSSIFEKNIWFGALDWSHNLQALSKLFNFRLWWVVTFLVLFHLLTHSL
jgi:hypothetical protein